MGAVRHKKEQFADSDFLIAKVFIASLSQREVGGNINMGAVRHKKRGDNNLLFFCAQNRTRPPSAARGSGDTFEK